MNEKLKEAGADVGYRQVGLLMHEIGMTVERTRKFKATTDSDHTFNIAPKAAGSGLWCGQAEPKWADTSATSGPAKYKPRRRHSALGWKSPVAFERKVA